MKRLFSRSVARVTGVAFLVLTGALWYGTTLVRLPTGVAAQFYASGEWSGVAKVATVDERVSTSFLRRDWPPANERLRVRWEGYLHLMRSRQSRLSLVSDNEARLYVDDRLVIDMVGSHQLRQVTADVPLARGVHALRLESSAAAQPFNIELLWAPRVTYPLSPLAGSAVSPRRLSRQEFAVQVAKDGFRAVAIGTWVVLYWAFLLRWGVVPGMRALIRHHAPNGLPVAAMALLGLSAALYVGGVTWGVPGPGWALDEISPGDLIRSSGESFYREWWSQNPKYPPAHFYTLGLILPPFLVWRWLDPIAFAASPALDVLLVMFRAVSVAMAVSTILMVYVCGTYLYNARSALVAAAFAALTMPMMYYAKIATLDVPYVFWFSVSLASFVRILIDDARVDYTIFASSAALAVSTKDQAYGLYGVPIVALACLSYVRANGESPIQKLAAMLRQRKLILALVVALATFGLCQNLIFNLGGFLFHIRYVIGTGAGPYRMFEPTIAGQWQLWRAVWMVVRVSFGWPAFVMCVLGLALSFWRPHAAHRRLWWALLPAASYYGTFLAPIGYAYDRFLLPVFIPLALAAGFGLSRILHTSRVRWPVFAGIAGALAYSMAYATAVNAALIGDSRFAVEAWIRANVKAGATVGVIGPIDALPRTDGFLTRTVSPNTEWLRVSPFDYIIVNLVWVERFRPGLPEHALYRDLSEERLGYRQVFVARTPIRVLGTAFTDRFEPFGSTGFSVLTRLNPPIEVYAR